MENTQAIEADWPFLLTLLPPDFEATAKETGALQRKRGVTSAGDLLRLAFAYGLCGLSLRGVALWARAAGVAQLSDVALLNRLRHAARWLGHLLAQKLAQRTALRPEGLPSDLRLRLVDATSVSRPGSKTSDFRLHLGFDLCTLTVDAVEVTTAAEGESLKQLAFQPGEIAMGDRGYAHRQGIADAVAAGAEVIVRLNWQNVPLQHPDGEPFDLLAALRSLGPAAAGEWVVRTAPAKDKTPAVPGRLVAIKKSPQAAEEARRKVRLRAKRKGQTPDARTLETAGYLFLFTTLSAARLTAVQVLELYRFRWQIELAFKRMKSLLELDELVAQDDTLCRTFLCVKLLATLMIEELHGRWAAFSPWGYGCPAAALAVASVASDR
jgi:DDE family transposase